MSLISNLEYIEGPAFYDCTSLQAVSLPPTITNIGNMAFRNCTSLRFLFFPEAIGYPNIGYNILLRCSRLLTTVKYKFDYLYEDGYDEDVDDYEEEDEDEHTINNDEVNQWLMQRYANLPLHQACSSISITPQVIVHGIGRERATGTEVDEYQMTALHILCANPHAHVTGDAIRAYLQLAPEAADQEDSEGMTPFQYLCRSAIDIEFLEEDRSFSSLMAWWYSCMPPQTEMDKKRKCE